ncbi:MAG TPA: sulfurtransferase [Vicinamibacterales bacterium]|nr:sulfurtransferase [Vicinamibacterales bacterium]
MTHTTLIDTATLASLLDSPDVAVVDCRFELASPGAGEAAFAQSHIPGASYAHLDRDLSGPTTGTNGRHPLPSPEALVATLGRLGIDGRVQVVAYDQDTGMYASRLWWLLRWIGHDAVAVLDGGFARWTAEGRPTTADIAVRPARSFVGRPDPALTVNATDLPAIAAAPGGRLVDARAPERYRGDLEPIDPVAGHIPGAINHFYQQNLSNGGFLEADALRTALQTSLQITSSGEGVVCYCGSGVTACHNLLALEHAGLRGARLYPGSWSEWVADPSRPVERG